MPQVGLGTWPLLGNEARDAVLSALQAGYRLIDTSEQYGNEDAVGDAIRVAAVARQELFVTTKFNVRWHGFDLAQEACRRSLDRLGLEYVDLLLIHWPNPWLDRYVDAWRGLIALRAAGLARAIGVSNFLPAHIDRLVEDTGVVPDVNQVELDPTLPQTELCAYHRKHGIATEAWGPLGRDGQLLSHPVIVALADRHGVSPAQVILRWHVEHGFAFTARSSNPGRIAANIDLFGFELDGDDLAAMEALDEGRAPQRDSETYGH